MVRSTSLHYIELNYLSIEVDQVSLAVANLGVGSSTKKVRRHKNDGIDHDTDSMTVEDVKPSFKDILLSDGVSKSMPQVKEDFDLCEGDVCKDMVDGISSIYFSKRVHGLIEKSVSNCGD